MMTSIKTRQAELEEKRRFWRHHIEDWRSSDLTQVDYCRRHGLVLHRFTYWKQKLKNDSPPAFIELKLPALRYPNISHLASPLRVSVSRFQVAVDRDFDPATLCRLVSTLEGL